MVSKIEKHNLENIVKEFRLRGYSYDQIIEEVRKTYGVSLSTMAISRYFNKIEDGIIEDFTNSTNGYLALGRINAINRKEVRESLDKYEVMVDAIRVGNPHSKSIDTLHNEIKTDYVKLIQRMQLLIKYIQTTDSNMKEFLIDISNEDFCNKCRKKMINKLDEFPY